MDDRGKSGGGSPQPKTHVDANLPVGENWLMAQYECFSCKKYLDGHPKIDVEGNIYCYLCAKNIVGIKDHLAEEQRAKYLKACEDHSAKRVDWNWKLESAQPSKTIQGLIIIGVAGGFAAFLDNPILFLPGLFVGMIVCHFYIQGRRKRWIHNHPEPADLPHPSISFLRDRIQLVDGESGTPLSSNYREQILERDGYRCQWCGEVYPADELEIHHIVPQAEGGKHFPSNLVTLCYHCHVAENWFGHKHKMR
jgi:hypothetical protein